MLQFFEDYVSGFLTITCIFVVLFYFASYLKGRRRLPLPPGPLGLPVVGYLPFLTKMQHLKCTKLAAKYGNVFSMRLGTSYVVVLNTGKVIREAFGKPEFLGRPTSILFNLIPNFESPFLSSGRIWQEQRRFAMQTMKDLGLGKSLMEKHILEEIQCFLEGVTKSDGMPINITEKLTPSMSNNICSLVFGHRYKYDDPQRIFLNEALDLVAQSFQQISFFAFFPWVKHLPFVSKSFQIDLLLKRFEDLRTFVRRHVDQHKKTLDPHDIRDYIDGYLTEMETRLEKDPQTVFSYNMLMGSVLNFFGAGSETVRTTVSWCLYIMAEFQDVQKKVQDEIDKVIGNERMPSFQDRKEMLFTQAVLSEVQRWKTVAPLGVARCTLEDTELQGYHIPKDTFVLANIYSAHHDPEEWENPEEFRPDRFLSNDGTSLIKRNSYMPFSTGRRSCPGEILALIELFLYFTSILQRFTVEKIGRKPLDLEGTLGITYRPKLQMLSFKRRP